MSLCFPAMNAQKRSYRQGSKHWYMMMTSIRIRRLSLPPSGCWMLQACGITVIRERIGRFPSVCSGKEYPKNKTGGYPEQSERLQRISSCFFRYSSVCYALVISRLPPGCAGIDWRGLQSLPDSCPENPDRIIEGDGPASEVPRRQQLWKADHFPVQRKVHPDQ